jgi:hypothetical protein
MLSTETTVVFFPRILYKVDNSSKILFISKDPPKTLFGTHYELLPLGGKITLMSKFFPKSGITWFLNYLHQHLVIEIYFLLSNSCHLPSSLRSSKIHLLNKLPTHLGVQRMLHLANLYFFMLITLHEKS